MTIKPIRNDDDLQAVFRRLETLFQAEEQTPEADERDVRVTYGVVCSGAAELQNRAALSDFLDDGPVGPFDADAATAHGPARLATRERKRDALDKLIAAHATALNVVLVTHNESDFSAYPGQRVENWVDNGCCRLPQGHAAER